MAAVLPESLVPPRTLDDRRPVYCGPSARGSKSTGTPPAIWYASRVTKRGYLVGLIGANIGTSVSPPLHEAEADALGLRYLYRLLDLDELRVPAGNLVGAARLAGYDAL